METNPIENENKQQYVEIAKEFRFEAAHYLPQVSKDHKCRRLHGHSYRFQVRLGGHINTKEGWLRDFKDITETVQPLLVNHLDHYCLNDVSGLENPTSENLAIWLWNQLKPKLPQLIEITVFETCTSLATYSGS